MTRDEDLVAPMIRIQPGHVFQVGNIIAKCCCRCGVSRELERFESRPTRPGGVDDICLSCRKRERKQKSRR